MSLKKEIFEKALKLKEQGKKIKEIMTELNITENVCTYSNFRNRLYRLEREEKNKIIFEDKKPVPTSDDINEYYNQLKEIEKAKENLDTKQTCATITLEEDKPVLIAFSGDWHIGAQGLDYEQFDSDRKLIKETDGAYFIGMGDYIDNASPHHHKNTGENTINQDMQRKLAMMFMTELSDKCLALIRGCFLDGTEITMSDGTKKNIEEIKSGDLVISGDGKIKKVLKKFNNYHSGNIYEFNTVGSFKPSIGTDIHNVFTIKKEIVKRKDLSIDDLENFLEWKELKDIEKGDYLVKPRIHRNLSNKFSNSECYLFGLFLAEGHYMRHLKNKYGIEFTFSINEIHLARIVKTIIHRKYGKNITVTITKRPEKGQISVRIYSAELASLFYTHCGEYSYGKNMSEELFNDYNRNWVISGYLDGDGHLRNHENNPSTEFETTSKKLADQICRIYNENGWYYSADSFNRKDGIRKQTYRVRIADIFAKNLSSFNNKIHNTNRVFNRRGKQFVSKNYIFTQITNFKLKKYIGKTHDFEVEDDHCYLVGEGLKVHNCHECVSYKLDQRDLIEEFAEAAKAINLWHGGKLNIKIGDQNYKIFARHKYKNESSMNTTNAQRSMLNDAGPCDICALAHKHFPDLQMLDRMGDKVIYLRSGSYKKYDEFGQRIGGYSAIKAIPSVIIYPNEHKLVPFQELEDAVTFLKAIRN